MIKCITKRLGLRGFLVNFPDMIAFHTEHNFDIKRILKKHVSTDPTCRWLRRSSVVPLISVPDQGVGGGSTQYDHTELRHGARRNMDHCYTELWLFPGWAHFLVLTHWRREARRLSVLQGESFLQARTPSWIYAELQGVALLGWWWYVVVWVIF